MKKANKALLNSLNKHLQLEEECYHVLGETKLVNGEPHTYIDNGGSILAVAHLDSVGEVVIPQFKGQKVISRQLDDRLGVWVLMELLPKLGCVPFDILFTTNEEIGASTAGDFRPSKDYNWIFSFDRRGDDAVMYDYEDQFVSGLVGDYGWQIGSGSFSDISYLEHLGVKGFNFGTGYHDEHTAGCHADLRDTIKSATKFVKLAAEMHDTRMEHNPRPKSEYKLSDATWERYANGKVSSWEVPLQCSRCYEVAELDWRYCPQCGSSLLDHIQYDDEADWVIK